MHAARHRAPKTLPPRLNRGQLTDLLRTLTWRQIAHAQAAGFAHSQRKAGWVAEIVPDDGDRTVMVRVDDPADRENPIDIMHFGPGPHGKEAHAGWPPVPLMPHNAQGARP